MRGVSREEYPARKIPSRGGLEKPSCFGLLVGCFWGQTCICWFDVSGTDSRLIWVLRMRFVFGQLVAFHLSCPFRGCSRAIITKDIEGDNNTPLSS